MVQIAGIATNAVVLTQVKAQSISALKPIIPSRVLFTSNELSFETAKGLM